MEMPTNEHKLAVVTGGVGLPASIMDILTMQKYGQ